MQGKKILLLGGTGAMGAHLSKLLSDRGAEVYVTTRSERHKEPIHFIRGNARNTLFLKEILNKEHYDVIVDFMIYSTRDFSERCDFILSQTDHYIFLSSSRVYADTQPCIKESSPRLLDVCNDDVYLSTDEYALSKAREEDILKNSKKQNWTIIRPYITYSETRLQLGVLEKEYWLYQALHNRTIVFSKDIASKTTTLTYGYDVARGIAALIGKPNAMEKIFHITCGESHTWQEIFDLYIRVLTEKLGHSPKVKIIDENPRVQIPTSKWQVVYDRWYDRRFDNSAINEYIDTTTFVPMMEGLESCLREFLKQPSFKILGWGDHAMYDRITGEWTPLKEIPTWDKRIKYILRRTLLPKQ